MPKKRRVPPIMPKRLCTECVAMKAAKPGEAKRDDTLCTSHAAHRDNARAKAQATHAQRTAGDG